MRTLVKGLLVAASLGVAPQLAHADCQATGCYSVHIEQLVPTATNGVWIQTSGNEALMNCTADSGLFIHLSTTAGGKEIYALLLAAHVTDELVTIVISEGTNPCAASYAYVNRL
jgi:hypothetical protein